MALPSGFGSLDEYFSNILHFLSEHKWLYCEQNTNVLLYGLLDSFPRDWKEFFSKYMKAEDFIELGLGTKLKNAPHSLNKFMDRVKMLQPIFEYKNNDQCCTVMEKGLSLKKQHEISVIGPVVYDMCLKNGITHVVDIGCGKGYLTEYLRTMSLNVLGIDGNANVIAAARKKYPRVAFHQLMVTETSTDDIISLLSTYFSDRFHKIALISLHACADLTVDILKLSIKIPNAAIAFVMPCCYHRMKNNNGFDNFPLSTHLKQALVEVEQSQQSGFLNTAFLRLACQRSNWLAQTEENLATQVNNLLFRNILQFILDKEKLTMKRKRRKTGCHRDTYNIDDFLNNLSESFSISDSHLNEKNLDNLKTSIKLYYEEFGAFYKPQFTAYIALQNLIQSLCENVILLDRCAFMQDQGMMASTLKVANACISPRCYAIASIRPVCFSPEEK